MEYWWIILAIAAAVVLLLILLRKPAADASEVSGANHVHKSLYETIVAQHEMLRGQIADKEIEIRDLHAQLAAREQQVFHLQEQFETQKSSLEKLQIQQQQVFENVANRLLEEKSSRFSQQNAQQLQSILLPLKERIHEFELNINQKFTEETKEKSSLKKELEQLRDLNQQLSKDANNLAGALKGQNKLQGNWGEYQLELLLEKAGLQKGLHYDTQKTYKDDGGSLKRPDFILHLPEDKHLIIDAKVSLTAWERFYNEEKSEQRELHLRAHVASLRGHIESLRKTNYQLLYQINAPDYLILFIPLESALTDAIHAEPKLFTEALESNIVMVSTGSLLTTIRTVAHLWRQEKQSRSALEIARQSGLLYDKFVAFVEDLKLIGSRIDSARVAYDDAMNKLITAARPGDTLVGKAEKIRELGAKTNRSLPKDLTNNIKETEEDQLSV
ncbi:MAG: DNA recombination protein RmuC [Chitinophagales bacterium]|nr:DNA recombination protein RmuC [Chitinophagales bacterium]